MRALPRERAKAPYSPAEIAAFLALADAQPTVSRRMRAAGLVCLGAGAGLTGADLRGVRGADVVCRSGGVLVDVRGARPRAVPVLARYHQRLLACAEFAGPGLVYRRDQRRAQEHHHPADPVAGRRGRAAPAGGQPAAVHLAGMSARSYSAWPPSCPPPGSPAPSGSATCSPPWTRPMRPPLSRCPGRHGEHPACRARGDHRRLRRRAADRGAAARRGAAPPADASAPCWPGCCLAQAGHRPAHLTRVRDALTALPADDQRPARRDRRLENRPAPAHLPADRADLRPGRGRRWPRTSPTACPRTSSQAICDDLLEASVPEEHKHASTALAVDWTDVETFSRPPPRGTRDCAGPEASWGHRSGTAARQDSELFFGYYLSAATMMRDETRPARPRAGPPDDRVLLPARPGPRLGPGTDRDARGRHPARRHPRRLRLRPPRRRRLGHPAARSRRAAGPGPAPRSTAAPRAPTTAPSSPTATSTAR